MVRVSYLEIYNEEVRDLLGKDQMQRLEVKYKLDFIMSNYLLLVRVINLNNTIYNKNVHDRLRKDQMLEYILRTSPGMLSTMQMTWTEL